MSRQSELAALGRVADTGALSNRRLTYNGAMNVWQRGTSADTASSGDYMCDRWRIAHSGLDGNVDWDQETSSTPDSFAYALKVSTDASETSLDAGDYLVISQRFEGQDLQMLQKGTSGAKKLALSFWVRSSVASTYTVEFRDDDNNRTISKSYTISAANTWEYKTIILEGDTTGSFDTDANQSAELLFWVDGGSTWSGGTFSTAWQADDSDERLYDTTGWLESSSPTFYITGVQLEVNTVTDFEHRSYGDELARCQRYFYQAHPQSTGARVGTCVADSSGNAIGIIPTTVPLRGTPTLTTTASDWGLRLGGTALACNAIFALNLQDGTSYIGVNAQSSGLTSTRTYSLRSNNASARLQFDAEL